jgi:O-methyltransferase
MSKFPYPRFAEHTMVYKAASIIGAEKVAGDYLEFGVYSGGSFIQAYHVIRRVFSPRQKPNGPERSQKDRKGIKELWETMRFFAFDSFQGLPQHNGIDKQSRDFVEGKYKCSEQTFRKNLVRNGVPLQKVISQGVV